MRPTAPVRGGAPRQLRPVLPIPDGTPDRMVGGMVDLETDGRELPLMAAGPDKDGKY